MQQSLFEEKRTKGQQDLIDRAEHAKAALSEAKEKLAYLELREKQVEAEQQLKASRKARNKNRKKVAVRAPVSEAELRVMLDATPVDTKYANHRIRIALV